MLSTIFIFLYLSLYVSVNKQYRENIRTIDKEVANNSEIIKIKAYPSFSNCNINPTNEYHIMAYKRYFKIPETTQLDFVDNNWKIVIFYRK